jgi:hypothetical protein
MSARSFGVIACLAALSIVGVASPVAAQPTPTGQGASSSLPQPRQRILVNPQSLHRRCQDWYVLQYRPSGTVLFPQYHCWWVRG